MGNPKAAPESYQVMPGQKPLDFQELVPKIKTYAKEGTSPSNAAYLASVDSADKHQAMLDAFGGSKKIRKAKKPAHKKKTGSRKQKGGETTKQVITPSLEPPSAAMGWNSPDNAGVLSSKASEILLRCHNNNSTNYCLNNECKPMNIDKLPPSQNGGRKSKKFRKSKHKRSVKKTTKRFRFAFSKKQSRKRYNKVKKSRSRK